MVLIYVVYSRRRESTVRYAGPDDDVRENIINYEDEGGGEDDMTAYDITPLQIPIGGPGMGLGLGLGYDMKGKIPYHSPVPMMSAMGAMGVMGGEPNVGVFIDDHKRRADTDLNAPPYDDLRNYAYEGGGSTAGSLSSLASEDEEQDFDHLNGWGTRFQKLADMYGDGDSEEEESEEDEDLQ